MYSVEERVFLVLEYHRLNHSPTATRRSFQKRFQVAKGPDGKTIRELFKKFQQTGNVADAYVGNVGPTHSVVTPENATTLAAVIERHPNKSVRRLAAESGITPSSTYRILRKTLHMFPYKIQCRHAIPVRAERQREDFANEMLNMIDGSGFDVGRIWFTDEAHFHLDGVVNRHNWRFWGTEKPHFSHARPLHCPKLTVWAAISCKGIIGPFFLRETVTTDRYIALLKQFVATQQALDDRPGTAWFMQDGARPHRTEAVFHFLDEYFDDRVIALKYSTFQGKGMDWPPYSPDLTPCDYFLWGTLKDIVYCNNPSTLEELEEAICQACVSISGDTLQRVTDNFILRLRHLCSVKGAHFETLLM